MLPAMAATSQSSTATSAVTQMLAAAPQPLPPGLLYSVGGMPFPAGAGGINFAAAAPVALITDQSKKDDHSKDGSRGKGCSIHHLLDNLSQCRVAGNQPSSAQQTCQTRATFQQP